MSVNEIGKKRCTVSPHRNAYSLLEYPASKFYKYIVIEKVDHIDNVVFGVLCLAISVILNKTSIQSMNHNIRVSSLARLRPKGICDKVF